jgi:putative phosphoribosyl transferase
MTETARKEIFVAAEAVRLPAFFAMPWDAHGVVLFAHGSGSSRFSPRNREVADDLNAQGFATVLLDLLSEEEHVQDRVTREFRFDIPLLAERLVHAIDQVRGDPDARTLPVGLFGASTGAAAALIAASRRPDDVQAVVSRGGRPDLAGEALPTVRAPVLLIVGGLDDQVIELNRRAAAQLNAPHRVVIVPGASHLFEEPGKMEEVERLAGEWFEQQLTPRRPH